MDELRVRLYNVRFGDAILVSVPDRSAGGAVTLRHILIDFGNLLSDKSGQGGGDDAVFLPVAEDILRHLNGRPLDLFVMTHEHMDHVQGMLSAVLKGRKIEAEFAWLTASAAEDYYERHPKAREERLALQGLYGEVEQYLSATRAYDAVQTLPQYEPLRTLLLNNNPRSTEHCVAYLRGLARHTAYVYRGFDLKGCHPFEEAQFEIWGPEEDTAVYYPKNKPLHPGFVYRPELETEETRKPGLNPLAGVDAGAFFDLVDARRRGCSSALLAIDRAANNTSVVFSLEWRGWRLLFPGDAEKLSWEMMDEKQVLRPVHFLKVSHHASRTGMPALPLLEKVLPLHSPDKRERVGLVSTAEGPYEGVPDPFTLDQLSKRIKISRTGRPDEPVVLTASFPDLSG